MSPPLPLTMSTPPILSSRSESESTSTSTTPSDLEKPSPHVFPQPNASCPTLNNSPLTDADLADRGESGKLAAERPRPSGWERWAAENVATKSFILPLVLQAFATGILDATTYNDYQTFASNQTGNIILLTLAALGTPGIKLVYTAVSFAGFVGAAFIFGQFGHIVGVRRRAWILFSTCMQTLCLLLAAIFLSPSGPFQTRLGSPNDWAAIFFFAAMSGAQVVMARQSSCQELPTAPMTSPFVDFVSDQNLFISWGHEQAGPRNRRFMYLFAMIIGSFIGAALDRHTASWIVVVVTCACKAVVIGMLAFAKAD